MHTHAKKSIKMKGKNHFKNTVDISFKFQDGTDEIHV